MVGWCRFRLTAVFRLVAFISTHVTWTLFMLMNCLYFQAWKSYDILWYWLHFALTLAVPAMRHHSAVFVCCKLIGAKCCAAADDDGRKPCGQIYRELFRKHKTRHGRRRSFWHNCMNCLCCKGDDDVKLDGRMSVEEAQPHVKPDSSDLIRSLDRTTTAPAVAPDDERTRGFLSTLPAAIDTAIYLYRFRISVALIIGNTRQRLAGILPPTYDENSWMAAHAEWFTEYGEHMWHATSVWMWIDIVLTWLSVIQAYYRQCQLCCKSGLCRCIQWLILIVIIGMVFMEVPMLYVKNHLDGSWCLFERDPR